jgi:serine acetyltransferase
MLRADYARTGNRSTAQRVVLFIFRFGQYQHARGRHGVLFGAELPPSVRVGPGLALPHCGRGVVIDAQVEIGENSMIFHGVTIAAERVGDGAPRLADNVMVSPGACIVGSIDVGSGARIGPNAVVVCDVAPRSLVFSVGCRVITAD